MKPALCLESPAETDPDVHIVSVLIHTRPDDLQAIEQSLTNCPGLDIHAADPSGKIVATLESEDESWILDQINNITHVNGVLSANLVYHQCESAASLEEPITYGDNTTRIH